MRTFVKVLRRFRRWGLIPLGFRFALGTTPQHNTAQHNKAQHST
eukprot:COSAG06_NODE_40307_length_403_cov_0.759868_1_plen_43_part_10